MKKKLTLTLLATFICATTAIKTTTFAMENTNQQPKTTLTLNEQVKLEDDLETEINNVKFSITKNVNDITKTLNEIEIGEKTALNRDKIDKNIEKIEEMESYHKKVSDEINILYNLSDKFKEHEDIDNIISSLKNIKTLVKDLGISINDYKILNIFFTIKNKESKDSYEKKVFFLITNIDNYDSIKNKLTSFKSKISSLAEQILEETKKIKTAIKTTTFAMENTNQQPKTTLTLYEQINLEDDLETGIDDLKFSITKNVNSITKALNEIKNGGKTALNRDKIDKNIHEMELCYKNILNSIHPASRCLLRRFKEHINISDIYNNLENIKTLFKDLGVSIHDYKLFIYNEFDSYMQKSKKLEKEGNPSKYKEEEITDVKKELGSLNNVSSYVNEDKLTSIEKAILSITKQILDVTKKIEFVREKPKTDKFDNIDNISEKNLMDLFRSDSYTIDEKFEKIKKTDNKELIGKFLSLYVTKLVNFFMKRFDAITNNESGLNLLKNFESFMKNLSWLKQKLMNLCENILDESNRRTYRKYLENISEIFSDTMIYLNKTKNLEKEILNKYKNKSDDDIKKEAERIFDILSNERDEGRIRNFEANINTRDEQISLIVRYNIKVDEFTHGRINELRTYLENLKDYAKSWYVNF